MTEHNKQDFTDFEIRIFPSDASVAGYPVEITLGEQQEFPRGRLAADLLPWVSSGDPLTDGQRLFEALLADQALRSAWDRAQGQAPQRRIRLWIDVGAAELHTLPWELLQAGGTMLSADADTPFSRYLPVSEPWGGAVEERPIRVLAVISSPNDLEKRFRLALLDVSVERSILKDAFFALDEDEILLDVLDAPVALERLEEKLREGLRPEAQPEGYHILHYVGHGGFNKRERQAALYLQDEEGDTEIVRDGEFINMLSRLRVRPRLVFLAACQSATRSTADAFRGLGPGLVAAGVPAVVAMQDFVAIKTARKLSEAFYRQLAEHGLVDLAMNEARGTLLTAGRPDAAVPVLFMRLKSGQLWSSETEEDESMSEEKEKKVVHQEGGVSISGSDVQIGGSIAGRDMVVHGDQVHGDKVAGDKVGGDKISVGDISGGAVALGRGRQISTGGGAYVEGQVDTGGGDFVGRDQVKTVGLSGPDIAELFKPIYAAIEARPGTPPEDRADMKVEVEEIQAEVAKGETADESFLARRLRNLKRMAPDILKVVLATLANPAAGLGMVAQQVAERMQAEAG